VKLLPMQSPHSFLFVFFSFPWGLALLLLSTRRERGARYKVDWEDDDASMQWLQTLQSSLLRVALPYILDQDQKLHSGPIPRSLIKANAKLDQRIAMHFWNSMHHPPLSRGLHLCLIIFWGFGLRMRR
jgi:hypothetical protein